MTDPKNALDVEEQEIDLQRLLKFVVNTISGQKKLLFLLVLGCTLIATGYSLFMPNVYESTVLLEPATIQKNYVETIPAIETMFQNPNSPYIKRIAKELGINDKQTFGLVKAFSIGTQADYLTITAEAETPEKAAKMAELMSSCVLERQNQLVKYALAQINEEKEVLIKQIANIEKEEQELNKKALSKEKTDILAQAYIYQSITIAHENAVLRHAKLLEQLRQKNFETNYYTKEAKVIIVPTSPSSLSKISPIKKKVFFNSLFISFGVSLLALIVIGYFKKGCTLTA